MSTQLRDRTKKQETATQFGGHVEIDAGKDERRGQGVRDILSGAVLIGIGFAFGGSVFLGNPTAIDWLFDGLGTFWIGKGLYTMFT